jgi:hypothetical protein
VILICLIKQAELLGSGLKGWNLLHQDSEICFFRECKNEAKEIFSLIFCNDVCSVIKALGHQLDPTEWRLCIDSSKVCIKLVLLHNGNTFPTVLLAHAANMKESCENIELLLGKIHYEKYN